MTPIEVLLSLELPDASIARRLRVDRRTVGRWRKKACTPESKYQTLAATYLAEIRKQIDDLLFRTLFSKAV